MICVNLLALVEKIRKGQEDRKIGDIPRGRQSEVIINKTQTTFKATMSEYCDIFPEDPTCATPEEEVVVDEVVVDEETNTGDAAEGDNEEADAEEMDGEMMEEMEEDMMEKMEKMDWDMTPSQMWMKAGDLMKFTSIDPFMGTITYLMVAIGVTTSTALDLFRYKSDSDYYDATQTGSKDDIKTVDAK